MEALLLFMMVVGGVVYFLPAIIAGNKNRPNAGAIMAVNILLGWTLVGWVVALAWALMDDRQKTEQVAGPQIDLARIEAEERARFAIRRRIESEPYPPPPTPTPPPEPVHAVEPTRAPAQATAAAPNSGTSRGRNTVIIVACVVGMFAVLASFESMTGVGGYESGAGSYESEDDLRVSAQIAAPRLVKRNPKAPKTATFPPHHENIATKADDAGNWKVTGYLESENDEGVKVRSQWTVLMWRGRGTWYLKQVDIR